MGLALATRLVALGTTDLADLPGPAGHQILAAAYADRHPMFPPGENLLVLLTGALGEEGAPSPDRHFLLERMLVHLGGDHALVLQLLVLVGGLAAVAGVMAAARSLGGRASGLAGGCCAALWAPSVMGALLVGDEEVAAGLVWGGLGLFWAGMGGGWRRLPLCVAGALSVVVGAQVRESVAPLVPLMVVALALPAGARRRAAAGAVGGAALGLTVWLYSVGGFRYATETDSVVTGSLLSGLEHISALTGGLTGDTLWLLLLAALVAALVPGPQRWQRALLGLCLLPLLGLSAAAGGELLRLRHLYQLGWPLLVLVGCGVGLLWTRSRVACLIVTVVGVGHLALDGLDMSSAWSAARVQEQRSWPSTLPGPVPGWRRYLFSRSELNSLTVPAGRELMERTAVPRLVTVYLHDERQSLALLNALRGGGEVLLVEPRECCRGRTGCAEWLLDRAEGRLVLPDPQGLAWSEVVHVDFVRSLLDAAGPPDGDGVDWDSWELQGSSSEPLCDAGAVWGPDAGNPMMKAPVGPPQR